MKSSYIFGAIALVLLFVGAALFFPRWQQKGLDTGLMNAALAGDNSWARQLIEDGANVNSTVEDNWTPLMQATTRGNADVVQILLDHGANVDAAQAPGNTALYMAVLDGRVRCVQILLAKGANPNATTRFQNILDLAESVRRNRRLARNKMAPPTVADMDEIIVMLQKAGATPGAGARSRARK